MDACSALCYNVVKHKKREGVLDMKHRLAQRIALLLAAALFIFVPGLAEEASPQALEALTDEAAEVCADDAETQPNDAGGVVLPGGGRREGDGSGSLRD